MKDAMDNGGNAAASAVPYPPLRYVGRGQIADARTGNLVSGSVVVAWYEALRLFAERETKEEQK